MGFILKNLFLSAYLHLLFVSVADATPPPSPTPSPSQTLPTLYEMKTMKIPETQAEIDAKKKKDLEAKYKKFQEENTLKGTAPPYKIEKFKSEHNGLDPSQFINKNIIDPITGLKKENLIQNVETTASNAANIATAVNSPDAKLDPILAVTKNSSPNQTPQTAVGNVQTYNLDVNKNQAGQSLLTPTALQSIKDNLAVIATDIQQDPETKNNRKLTNDAYIAYLTSLAHQYSKTNTNSCTPVQDQVGKDQYSFEYVTAPDSKDKVIAVTPYKEDAKGQLVPEQSKTLYIIPTKENESVLVKPEIDKTGTVTFVAYDYKIRQEFIQPTPFSGIGTGDFQNAGLNVQNTQNQKKGSPSVNLKNTSPVGNIQVPTSINVTVPGNNQKMVMGLNAENQVASVAYGATGKNHNDQIELVAVSKFTQADLNVGLNWNRKVDNPQHSAGIVVFSNPIKKEGAVQGYVGPAKVQVEKTASEKYGKFSATYTPQVVTPNANTNMSFMAFVSKESTGGAFNIQQQKKNITFGANGAVTTPIDQPAANVSAGGFLDARTRSGDVSVSGTMNYNSQNSTFTGSYRLVYKKDNVQVYTLANVTGTKPMIQAGFIYTPDVKKPANKKLFIP